MGYLLEANNVEKSFGGLKALDGISLSVQENSITSVIGPNGSGKTDAEYQCRHALDINA